ncbi:reverse transcriptase domain-containing protein [Tanacetum coccineum]
MTFEATRSKEINETRINKNEPPRFKQDVQEKAHDDGVENKSSSILEKAARPLVKSQQSSIPFPNRVRKEKEEALQQNFFENLKQLDINISFIEALLQIPKYAKYLKCLLMNKSRLEKACIETMNERCLAVLLNNYISKDKTPCKFNIPCQVLEKHKEAEDLAADHLSRFESPHMEVLTEREISDKFSDEHLMELKSKSNNDEPWFRVPKALISDRGTHFFNSQLEKALQIYGVTHKLSTVYHPQSNGQTEVANRAIKPELRDGASENTRIYKEWTKKLHDSRLRSDKDVKIANTAYPNPVDYLRIDYLTLASLIRFSTVYTTYSLNEYSVYMYQYGVSWGMDMAYRLPDLVKEISTNIGEEFTNLEILKVLGGLQLQGGCSTQILANKLNMENLPSKY